MSRCALIVLSAHLSQLNWNQPCLKPAFRLCSGDLGCMMLQLFCFWRWGGSIANVFSSILRPKDTSCVLRAVFDWPKIIIEISLSRRHGGGGTVTYRTASRIHGVSANGHIITYWQDKVLCFRIALHGIFHDSKKRNASVYSWLYEAVHTSCLHTNRHSCLLSALILVNTDVYVRKRSDSCMIEVLKRRHSATLLLCPDLLGLTWFSSCASIQTLHAPALSHRLTLFHPV